MSSEGDEKQAAEEMKRGGEEVSGFKENIES